MSGVKITILATILILISITLWGFLIGISLNGKVNAILRKNSTLASRSEMIYKKDKNFDINILESKMSLNSRKTLNNMTDTERIISLRFYDSPKYSSQHREINTIFEVFVSLRDKLAENNVIAISCTYNDGRVSSLLFAFSIITVEELNEIYSSVQNDQLSRSDLVNEMAELWVNRYHYNRRWLDIAPENSYRESLLTPFSGGLSNNNSSEGFTLFYWHRHGLQVNKVNRRDGVASSSQIFSWADIGEEGPLYGAWDNNDNIWLYGETVGLMLLEFDGDKHWEQAEYVDETQIPYALRRVLETQ